MPYEFKNREKCKKTQTKSFTILTTSVERIESCTNIINVYESVRIVLNRIPTTGVFGQYLRYWLCLPCRRIGTLGQLLFVTGRRNHVLGYSY